MSAIFCTPLEDLAVLELKGGDPAKLLQGQITADLRLLTQTQALPGLLCNLKGRILSSFEIIMLGEDHLALVLPADTLAQVQAHLKKFEPFFKTQIQEVTADYQLLGLSGKETPALVLSLLGAWPQTDYQQAITDSGLILHLPGPGARALLLLHRDAPDLQASLEKIERLTTSTTEEAWRLLDIQVGRAQVNAELSDRFLPQMLNFQALGAVSFKKGCYTGQEIVARAQFRGQVKKRLHRLHLKTNQLALPANLYDAEGQPQGEILQLAPDGCGELEALAVINQKALETEQRFYADADQQIKASLLNLPYDVMARVALHGAEA